MPAVTRGVGRVRRCLDEQNLGIALVQVLHGVHVQLAEAAAEGLVLLAIEPLIAERQHLPVEEGLVDLLLLLVGQRPGEIDASDLGPDVGRERPDIEALVARPDLGHLGPPVGGSKHLPSPSRLLTIF